MKKAGTLTEDAAKNARDAVSKLWDEFLKANTDFAKQGGTEAKVAAQSLSHFAEIFGPNLQKIFQSMDDTIAEQIRFLKEKGLLQSGDVVVNTGSTPVQEHLSTNMLKITKVE